MGKSVAKTSDNRYRKNISQCVSEKNQTMSTDNKSDNMYQKCIGRDLSKTIFEDENRGG